MHAKNDSVDPLYRLAKATPAMRDDRGKRNPAAWLPTLVLPVLLVACSSNQPAPPAQAPAQADRYSQKQDAAPVKPVDVSTVADAIPREEPKSRYGNPDSYEVLGKRYYTKESSEGYTARGIASWYGTKFHGHRTSSGEPYDMYKMTAAHKTLPLPTYARVTNLDNGKTVVVKINDRGPFHDNRVMDLSYAAAARLEILDKGTGLVEIKAVTTPEPANIVVSRADSQASPPPAETGTATSTVHKPSLYLQVGAFASRDNAERLKNRLNTSLPTRQTQIFAVQANLKQVYRVRIGPLESVESADRLASSLSGQGFGKPQVVID